MAAFDFRDKPTLRDSIYRRYELKESTAAIFTDSKITTLTTLRFMRDNYAIQ